LEGLFEASPDPGVHTSATAESGLLLGLAAVLVAPFSVTHGAALVLGVLGTALSFGGVVATSNAKVAGRALAPWGLACAVVALLIVTPRYLGLDTAFGDAYLPTLREALEQLNSRVARP
jgi:hypothetical protein